MKDKINDYIDYKVGDWVETCHLMPAIVQVINKKEDIVEVFYPHYKEKSPEYTGGSCCSIYHCGVHKIDEATAKKVLSIGEERMKKLWHFSCNQCRINEKSSYLEKAQKKVEEMESLSDKEIMNYVAPFFIIIGSSTISGKEAYEYVLLKELEYLETCKQEYQKAWDSQQELYEKSINDLCDGIVTDMTQGIWLSYPRKTIKRFREGKYSYRIIEISTGEQFLISRRHRHIRIIKKLK